MTTEEQEEKYLKKLFELSIANDVDGRNMFSVGEKLGYDEPLVKVIVKNLDRRGYIGGLGVGPGLYITSRGKVRARGIDVDEHLMTFLKRMYEWTESKDPRVGNSMYIGESLGFDPDLTEVVTSDLRKLGYVKLSSSHGIRFTDEGIVEARSIE